MSLKSNLNSLYDPLLNKDELDGDSDNGSESQYQPAARNRRLLLNKRASIPIWMIATVAFLQVVTLFLLVKGGFKKNSCDYPNPQVLYSPVQDLVEYEVVKFRSGLNGEGDDIYSSPPSDEVDAAWEGLYNFGVSEISEQQALQLANVTMEVPNSDNKYVMLLDVFHELHCINMIRMALYPR
ncbi:hypothetical protein H0H93_004560 [Arthromyces matolae]|nr:hypothetical protein H0H93_004560 [Arthromyces matolae]